MREGKLEEWYGGEGCRKRSLGISELAGWYASRSCSTPISFSASTTSDFTLVWCVDFPSSGSISCMACPGPQAIFQPAPLAWLRGCLRCFNHARRFCLPACTRTLIPKHGLRLQCRASLVLPSELHKTSLFPTLVFRPCCTVSRFRSLLPGGFSFSP